MAVQNIGSRRRPQQEMKPMPRFRPGQWSCLQQLQCRHLPPPLHPLLVPPRHPLRRHQRTESHQPVSRSPHESAHVSEKYVAGYGAVRPRHAAHNLQSVALVEAASRGVLLPYAQVELAAQWPHYLGAELLEDMPSRPTELLRVHNLVEHDRPSWHVNVSNPRALFV